MYWNKYEANEVPFLFTILEKMEQENHVTIFLVKNVGQDFTAKIVDLSVLYCTFNLSE